jgi:hypothetical protein
MMAKFTSKLVEKLPPFAQAVTLTMQEHKLALLCWAHGMKAVMRRAVKGKHKGEYKLACGCWRGATMPDSRLTEQAT